MKLKECFILIQEDYLRIKGTHGRASFIFIFPYLIISASFNVTFLFRICSYLSTKSNILARFVNLILQLLYVVVQRNTGIQLPIGTKVGGGLLFSHFSSIVLAQETIVGRCCTIHQGVTIGRSFAGENEGCPTIGDNVIIFPGAKVFGKIKIGNNVIIGANSVVFRDISDGIIVAGNPAHVVSNFSNTSINQNYRDWFFFE
jgi:serine O-acetyltransferase